MQWFGNLVTMKWWNDLWLNEGFASFLEYLGVNSLKPEWKMLEQFILDKTQPALALDALISSHPISVAVHDPSEIEAIFDTISYSKGAAILHMLGNFLQQETLQNGLNDYLNTYKYSNADTKDLWNVFSKHTNQSLEVKVHIYYILDFANVPECNLVLTFKFKIEVATTLNKIKKNIESK